MKTEIFEYQEYKRYLMDWIHARPNQGHGVRSEMAEALRCQVAYISQILNAGAHLSGEQADALNRFIGHTSEEGHFFLLLVQLERAGTRSLKQYFREQVEQALKKRVVLKERLDVKRTLGIQNQAVYYGSWYYAAIHVALSIPELRTKEALARRFNLSPLIVAQALEFLVEAGLAEHERGRYLIGTTRIHLGDDSPLISKHHVNWRIQSMGAMDRTEESDLHYSSVVTVSAQDVLKLKAMAVKWIAEAKVLIRDSKEEDVHCLSLDFFRLKA